VPVSALRPYVALAGAGAGFARYSTYRTAMIGAPFDTLAAATPFPAMVQTPADVITGRLDGTGALAAVGVQLLWLTAVGGLGRLALRAASRRLVVQGG
jgi:ABC-2 type transport system permease protein